MAAIDLATRVTPAMIPLMKKAGIEAVCRYLSNSPAKNLTLTEAQLLSSAGIKCVVVWEAQGNNYANFNAAQGTQDATRACQQAVALNMPVDGVIYFAVDFDANTSQISSGIMTYMSAVNAVVRRTLGRIGIYGNGAVCAAMLDTKLVDKAWVWGAGGTNETQAFIASGRWSIRQHPTINEFGASVDPDDVQGDYGGWLLASAPAPVPLPSPTPTIIPPCIGLQIALRVAGFYKGKIDGDFGPASAAALCAYYTSIGSKT